MVGVRWRSIPAVTAVIGMAGLLIGCQTAPLGGTYWRTAEVIDADAEDRARIEKLDEALFAFTRDGRVISTYLHDDGTATMSAVDRYRVKDDVLTVKSPERELKIMYRMQGEQLRLHGEQFVILLDPVKSVETGKWGGGKE